MYIIRVTHCKFITSCSTKLSYFYLVIFHSNEDNSCFACIQLIFKIRWSSIKTVYLFGYEVASSNCSTVFLIWLLSCVPSATHNYLNYLIMIVSREDKYRISKRLKKKKLYNFALNSTLRKFLIRHGNMGSFQLIYTTLRTHT